MSRLPRSRGFSLIELLLVLAVIGILGAIAIPSFLGQRHRARVIGDAISNAKVLQLGLESLKSDTGTYGVGGTAYTWTAAGAGSGLVLLPTFRPQGNSKMNYTVTVGANSISYTLDVFDPLLGGARVYGTNEFGREVYRMYK